MEIRGHEVTRRAAVSAGMSATVLGAGVAAAGTAEAAGRPVLVLGSKGASVTYSIGPKQDVAVQASGRHLHPVKYDNFQDSSYLFVFALN